MKTLIVSAIAFYACLGASLGAKAYRIGMIQWAAYSPLNVAEEEGFWRDQDLDVDVIIFGSNEERNAALMRGRIDLALGMLGSWVGLQQAGIPIVILGEADWSDGGDKIVMKRGCDLSELRGQTIGIYQDQPSITYFLDHFLREQGFGLGDVNTFELQPEALADNFIAGRFDLMVNYDPYAIRAVNEGDATVVATSATYPGVIPEGFAALKDNAASIPHEDLVKIFRGWYRGVAWTRASANQGPYQKILREKTFAGTGYGASELRDLVGSVRIHSAAEGAERNAEEGPLSHYISSVEAFLQRTNILQKPISTSELVDTTAILEAARAESRWHDPSAEYPSSRFGLALLVCF